MPADKSAETFSSSKIFFCGKMLSTIKIQIYLQSAVKVYILRTHQNQNKQS